MQLLRRTFVLLLAAGLGAGVSCGSVTGGASGGNATSGDASSGGNGSPCFQHLSWCSCTCDGQVVKGVYVAEAPCANLVGQPCGDAGTGGGDAGGDGGDAGKGAAYASCMVTSSLCGD